MSDDEHGSRQSRGGLSTSAVEAITAVLLFTIGLVVIRDSQRLGAGWASDGPQSGYFPFYIGLLICFSSAVTLFQAVFGKLKNPDTFVERQQLKQILSVLLPATVYVGLIHVLGVYVASATYIAIFMAWLGGYSVPKAAAVGISVSVFLFLMFEKWFAVPLPKGPVERMLGF